MNGNPIAQKIRIDRTTTSPAFKTSSRARASMMSITFTTGRPSSGLFITIPSIVNRAMYWNAMNGTRPVANQSAALVP